MHFIVSILKKFNLIPVPILDVQLSICLARAIIEANNLGVFEALKGNREGLSSEELAQHVAISSEGAAILLNALEKPAIFAVEKAGTKTAHGSIDGLPILKAEYPIFSGCKLILGCV